MIQRESEENLLISPGGSIKRTITDTSNQRILEMSYGPGFVDLFGSNIPSQPNSVALEPNNMTN